MEPTALFAAGLAGGLVAGSVSCAAMQGGLLFGIAGPRAATPRPPGERPGGTGAPEPPCPHDEEPRPETARGRRPGAARGRRPGVSRRAVALVGAFTGARAVAHVAAGALLGLLGSAVRLGPGARAFLLVLAGTLVIVFAAGLLRRRDACHHHGAGRDGAAGEPALARAALLGLATILVPCGVTLATEVAAVSTGSALGGAAVMAGFVLGTTPAFAALGLAVRTLVATRLRAVAAVVAVGVGAVTIISGLRLGGWLPETGTAAAAVPVAVRQGGTQQVTVWATADGYRPGIVTARAGVPTEIVFRPYGTPGCTGMLTVQGHDVRLPATVRLPPQPAGSLRYVCSMGMFTGFITFQ